MASVSTEPVSADVGHEGYVGELRAKLERSERHRKTLEEWAAFLERELEQRDAELEEKAVELSFYEQELDRKEAELSFYRAELQSAEERLEADDDTTGIWSRITALLR